MTATNPSKAKVLPGTVGSHIPDRDSGQKVYGEAGPKFDTGKMRWSLLPSNTVSQVVEILEFGAVKYHIESWKKVENGRTRYYDAALRHIDKWWNGEIRDPETNKHHLAHAVCNLLFLIWKDDNNESQV